MSPKLQKDHTLLLIDSHALIHRAFHAFPPSLRTAEGELVNAVYGFAKLLLEVLHKFKPTYVVALFDAPGSTVRSDMYTEYKANRSAPDEDLISQIPRIEEMLANFSIPMLRVPGFEADDLIGTIDARHSGDWAQTIIMTGDRDLFQLVDEDTFVYMAGSSFSQSTLYDAADVEERMGIPPEMIIDYKGLRGDASDNIPGVKGIGDKSALELLTKFGGIEDIYAHIDEVEPKFQKKLLNSYEQAVMSKQLATIIKDVPVSLDFDKEAVFGDFDPEQLRQFFRQMQFSSLTSALMKLFETVGQQHSEQIAQVSMFEGESQSHPELINWEPTLTKGFDDEDLFVLADVEEEKDPLCWQMKSLSVLLDGKGYHVGKEYLSTFGEQYATKRWVTVGAKRVLHALANMGLEWQNVQTYDLAISTYLVSAGQSKQDLQGVLAWYGLGAEQQAQDAIFLLPDIISAEAEKLANISDLIDLVTLEQDLVPAVTQMERNGIKLDGELAQKYTTELDKTLLIIEKEIYTDVGHEFNIGSPKQVGEVLFVEKALPSGKKTKSGSYSTDERILKGLVAADPVVEKILEYRELAKLLSTYLRPLPKSINPQTGRVHGEFNQLGAVTGRFSSKNPNLQNIPLGEISGVNMRDAFVSEQGNVLIAFDYSQQELRFLAELSGEENMQEAFRKGQDIHARTASEIFEIPLADVSKEQRKVGKTVNFGVVYGISAYGLSDRLKIDPRKAADFIAKYFERYPRVRGYYDELLEQAKQSGYVQTIMGRRREAFGLKSSNYMLRQATEREIMNFPLQGSAADITKKAMLDVLPLVQKYPASLVLQVHDELIFEYRLNREKRELADNDLDHDKQLLDFVRNVRQTMLSVIKLKVPLEVGVDIGQSWGSLHEFTHI